MQHIYINDEGHWNKLTTGWILEVNDNEIEELDRQPNFWSHTFFGGREALAFNDGEMFEVCMPDQDELIEYFAPHNR